MLMQTAKTTNRLMACEEASGLCGQSGGNAGGGDTAGVGGSAGGDGGRGGGPGTGGPSGGLAIIFLQQLGVSGTPSPRQIASQGIERTTSGSPLKSWQRVLVSLKYVHASSRAQVIMHEFAVNGVRLEWSLSKYSSE